MSSAHCVYQPVSMITPSNIHKVFTRSSRDFLSQEVLDFRHFFIPLVLFSHFSQDFHEIFTRDFFKRLRHHL